MHAHLPPAGPPPVIESSGNAWRDMHAAATTLCPIMRDDRRMRSWLDLPAGELAAAFTAYRRHYPVRRAWEHAPAHFTAANDDVKRLAQALGLKLG